MLRSIHNEAPRNKVFSGLTILYNLPLQFISCFCLIFCIRHLHVQLQCLALLVIVIFIISLLNLVGTVFNFKHSSLHTFICSVRLQLFCIINLSHRHRHYVWYTQDYISRSKIKFSCFCLFVSFFLSFLLLKVYVHILNVSEWVCFSPYIQHLNTRVFHAEKSTVSPVQMLFYLTDLFC